MRGEDGHSPKDELKNFTNRLEERAAIQRLLDRPEGDDLPLLAFYGVGGAGKTWLTRQAMEKWLPEGLPAAHLDLVNSSGQPRYGDVPAALFEIRRQLGVECPAFELAYAMMRHHQGEAAPAVRGGAAGNVAWEFVVEGAQALANSVPGANVAGFVAKRLATALGRPFRESRFGAWVMSQAGNEDYARLRRMNPAAIEESLFLRLGTDLDAALPPHRGRPVAPSSSSTRSRS